MDIHNIVVNWLKEWIEEDLSVKIDVGLMARKAGYSKWYLQRIFFQSAGVTPGRYIIMRKMNKASQLLRDTNISVLQIAIELGYESQQSFTRAFKKDLGLPPGMWRARERSLCGYELS